MIYSHLIRPILYSIPADTIHPIVAGGGEFVAKIPLIGPALTNYYRINNPALKVQVLGVNFPNPIGLSAGFDKDGKYLAFAHTFGFGFSEVGSITGEPYAGNPKPWTRRLVKNQALIINYGLKSQGAEKVYAGLRNKKPFIPFGISVAKTNRPDCVGEKAIADYVKVFKIFKDLGNYYTINLSCPNTADGIPFSEPEALEKLLVEIAKARTEIQSSKPIFLKINPDLEKNKINQVIELCYKFNIQGLVISNLIKDHQKAMTYLKYPEEYNPNWPGGLSGSAVRQISTDCIRYVYQKTQGSIKIIGVGGVFTGDDAYEKIKAGASLIELITGFIFNGPTTIRKINLRLLELLQKDGYTNISQAVGKQQ
jgi:dihydroorotate dehydrogenase